jgi:hypothetical protein
LSSFQDSEVLAFFAFLEFFSIKKLEMNLELAKADFIPENYIVPGLTTEDIIDLKEVFDDFDLNSDGLITPVELRSALIRYETNASKNTVS